MYGSYWHYPRLLQRGRVCVLSGRDELGGSSTTLQSTTTSTQQQLGEILPDCGTPFNTLLNPAPKGTVYVKVITDQGVVITNGTLVVSQVDPAGG
jgi:hypothetical protein